MEGGAGTAEVQLVFEFELEFGDVRSWSEREVSELRVLSIARSEVRELEAELRQVGDGFSVAVTDVDLREGSIIVEVLGLLYEGASVFSVVTGVVGGPATLVSAYQAICERFLRRFTGLPLRARNIVVTVGAVPLPSTRSVIVPGPRAFERYLMAINVVLLMTLIGVLVVLLVRTGYGPRQAIEGEASFHEQEAGPRTQTAAQRAFDLP